MWGQEKSPVPLTDACEGGYRSSLGVFEGKVLSRRRVCREPGHQTLLQPPWDQARQRLRRPSSRTAKPAVKDQVEDRRLPGPGWWRRGRRRGGVQHNVGGFQFLGRALESSGTPEGVEGPSGAEDPCEPEGGAECHECRKARPHAWEVARAAHDDAGRRRRDQHAQGAEPEVFCAVQKAVDDKGASVKRLHRPHKGPHKRHRSERRGVAREEPG
mmetsp:Transcript_50056/g.113627  ORF Transcript_50056/g.113627 Transcript_50056/m.113627 type:complete len:214 (-) Transcript_50056:320-961(-)